jgi:hypothetical protein
MAIVFRDPGVVLHTNLLLSLVSIISPDNTIAFCQNTEDDRINIMQSTVDNNPAAINGCTITGDQTVNQGQIVPQPRSDASLIFVGDFPSS